MTRFLFKKTGYGLWVMAGVVTVVFFLFQGLGDPARLVTGQSGDAKTLDNIRKELALDKPLFFQYFLYLNDVSPFCIHHKNTIIEKGFRGVFWGGNWKMGIKIPYLRRSYQSKRSVSEILADALPGTILLAVLSMFFATAVGIILGVLSAIKKDSWVDHAAFISSVAGISAPSFFMGILIAWFFGFVLHDYTGLYMTGSMKDSTAFSGDQFMPRNMVLPALTLGIRPLAIIVQLTRSSLLETLSMDFIRTARSKGLSNTAVLLRHALPNALNPVITSITGWFAELLAGAFFVEYIFGWQGLGKTTVDALEKLDYPVVMGSLLCTALIFVLINILSDLLYTKLDPRVRLQ